jgi:hypothetical protein
MLSLTLLFSLVSIASSSSSAGIPEEKKISQGFAQIMTPAGCKMKKLYSGALDVRAFVFKAKLSLPCSKAD